MADDDDNLSPAERQELARARELNYQGDTNADPDARAPVDQRQDDEDEAPQRPTYGNRHDDEMDAISAKQDAELMGLSKEFDNDLSSPANTLGTIGEQVLDDEDGAPAAEAPAVGETPAPRPPSNAADDMLVELNVRGKIETVTVAEARRRAQITDAGESYMQEARGILEEAKQIREAMARGETPMTQEQIREGERGLSQDQIDRRRELIEQITYGNPDEAAKAMGRFQEETIEQAAVLIEQRREQVGRKDNFMDRVEYAKKTLAEDMPDLLEHPGRVKAWGQTLADGQKTILAKFVENLPEDERAHFARYNVTPELLRGLTSPKRIMEAYADFSIKGYAVPPIDQVMVVAGQIARNELGLPALPAQPGRGTTPANDHGRGRVQLSSERQARKDGLTPQPARASVGQGQSPQTQRREVSEADFHREALAERQQAGYQLPSRRR